jgi:hypothetical protein
MDARGINNVIDTSSIITGNSTVLGYNKVIEVIQIKNMNAYGYILERFDGHKSYLFDDHGTSMIALLYNTSSVYKLVGDIVNIKINKTTRYTNRVACEWNNNKIQVRTVEVISSHCVPLKNYCPTLDGIMNYLEYFYLKDKDYKHTVDIINRDTEVRKDLSKEVFDGIKAKFNMLGKKYVTVDINTILAEFDDKNIVYTMQPAVFSNYITSASLGADIETMKQIKNVRNYRIEDIPTSQYTKYLDKDTVTTRTEIKGWSI